MITKRSAKLKSRRRYRPKYERVQTGLRLEKQMLKVLKALAEYLDLSLGEMVELLVLDAFDGRCSFSTGTLRRIGELKKIYGMEFNRAALQSRLFED